MIDVKEAARISINYFSEIPGYSEYAKSSIIEEVELTEDEKYWLVTLGYKIPINEGPFDIMGLGVKYSMKYKVFKINADSGKVYSMKIKYVSPKPIV
ncbi:MAG: hypothetical protein ACYCXB_09335 [Candidatus Humimicrobiaceae bacterium]